MNCHINSLQTQGGLLLNNILMAAGGLCMIAAKYAGTYWLLILGRFVIGINCGVNAGIAPMYLSEISPTALRGSIGTVYQLVITISILFSQVQGPRYFMGQMFCAPCFEIWTPSLFSPSPLCSASFKTKWALNT